MQSLSHCVSGRVSILAGLFILILNQIGCTAKTTTEVTRSDPESSPEQWRSVGWGGGGFYWACAFHQNRNGTIYLGGDVNGMYRSDDHGLNWRMINSGIGSNEIYTILTDPNHPDTIYVAAPNGLSRSDDCGENWTYLSNTNPKELSITAERSDSTQALAIDSYGAIWAATPKGKIYRSKDRGTSWNNVYSANDLKRGFSAIAIARNDPRTIFVAAPDRGILRSIDYGETWSVVIGEVQGRHIAVSQGIGSVVYAACGKDGVWRSDDLGATWTILPLALPEKWECIAIAISANDPDLIWAISNKAWSGRVHRSADGGKSWNTASEIKPDFKANPTLPDGGKNMSTLRSIAVNPHDPKELFVAGNWRNGWSNDGGVTWEERIRGADISCITDIRFSAGRTYATAMDEGLLVSDDKGANWRQLFPLKYNPISGHHWGLNVRERSTGEVAITTICTPWNSSVNQALVSENGGKSFESATHGLPTASLHVNTMWGVGYGRSLVADPKNPEKLWLGIDGDPDPGKSMDGGGIFKSLDGGRSWTRPMNQPASRRIFYGLAVDPTNTDRIIWGSCGKNGGVYISEDGGDNWTLSTSGEKWVWNVIATSNGTIYFSGKNLWRSSDSGKTWEQVTNFEDNLATTGLVVDPQDQMRIWISRISWDDRRAGGIYASKDGGVTWLNITYDIPRPNPVILRYNSETSELWAGMVGLYKIRQ